MDNSIRTIYLAELLNPTKGVIPMPAAIDLEALDDKERRTFEAMLAKMGTSVVALSGMNPLADPTYRAKCKALRSEFETIAKSKGVALDDVFVTKMYINGDKVFIKGKPPKWLEGLKDADKAKYLITND
jgi:hypothetical protein